MQEKCANPCCPTSKSPPMWRKGWLDEVRAGRGAADTSPAVRMGSACLVPAVLAGRVPTSSASYAKLSARRVWRRGSARAPLATAAWHGCFGLAAGPGPAPPRRPLPRVFLHDMPMDFATVNADTLASPTAVRPPRPLVQRLWHPVQARLALHVVPVRVS